VYFNLVRIIVIATAKVHVNQEGMATMHLLYHVCTLTHKYLALKNCFAYTRNALPKDKHIFVINCGTKKST